MNEDRLTLRLSQPDVEDDKVEEEIHVPKKQKVEEPAAPCPLPPELSLSSQSTDGSLPPSEHPSTDAAASASFCTFMFLGPSGTLPLQPQQQPPPPLYVEPSWQTMVPPPPMHHPFLFENYAGPLPHAPPQQHVTLREDSPPPPPPRPARAPRNPIANGKSEFIEPPYAWAANRRATLQPMDALIKKGIDKISGEVQCRRCDHKTTITYDLVPQFNEVADAIISTKDRMHRRAPPRWMNPAFPACPSCGQDNCMKPMMAPKKRAINWLFMLLGQTLGTCTLEQLKYFCKHMRRHRTGAKNRLLYTTYLEICRQLEPEGPFEDD